MAGDGTVLATTGAYPEGQAHIVAYSEVDFRAGRWAGDPLAQRLPTDQSTGNRFLVEDAPQEIAFGVEHVGTSQIDVRYTCDIGTPGIPAEVRYDEPRGRGGAGRFVLVVPDGATLCQWWIGDWDGDFRIVSAE
jgi:hypothetical protein